MNATLTTTEAGTGRVPTLPPEILFKVFSFLWDEVRLGDVLHLCQVCKSWRPIAQAILYRSVTLLDFRTRKFTRTIEENEGLAPLIKHLTLDRSNSWSEWVSVQKVLHVLSPHKTLLSFHLPAITRMDPESVEFIQSISLLSFLGHLDIDINIFPGLHAVKQFIASFPQLRILDINDEFGQDVEWLDESASDAPIEFPLTIRSVGYHLGARRLLDAFLRWVADNPDNIERFSVTISPSNGQASLASTLRSFGAKLNSLSLIYFGPTQLPSIDLRANTNLRSLMIMVAPFEKDVIPLKEHLSAVLRTLSSASLEIVEFDLWLDSPISPRYDFMDWGVLDQAIGNASVRISVLCREKRHIAGVEEGVVGQMPRHREQRILQCVVSAVFA